jgi:stage III sporulation protein AG
MNPGWRTSLRNLWHEDRPGLWRLLVVGVIGIALVAWGSWGGSAPAKTSPPTVPATTGGSGLAGQEAQLDSEVAAIVEAIPGSGRVAVAVSLAKGALVRYGTHNTSEQDMAPQVSGVVVVASGAGRANVRQEIIQAVETLLQVSAYQVVVLPNGAAGGGS